MASSPRSGGSGTGFANANFQKPTGPTGMTLVPGNASAVEPGKKAPAPVGMKYYKTMAEVPATGGYMKGSGAGLNWVVPPQQPVRQHNSERNILASIMHLNNLGGSGTGYNGTGYYRR